MKKQRTSGISGTGKGFAETGQNISWTRRSTISSSSVIAIVDDTKNGSGFKGVSHLGGVGVLHMSSYEAWELSHFFETLRKLYSRDSIRTDSLLYLSRALAIRHIVSTPSFLASSHSRGVSLRTNATYPVDSHRFTSYWTASTIWSTGLIRG